MNSFQKLIFFLGSKLSIFWSLVLVISLNLFWSFTLQAYDQLFESVTEVRPLDLLNIGSIVSTEQALENIQAYNQLGRTLYWSFYILDNPIPLLLFGSFSILWVSILSRQKEVFFQKIAKSKLVLIPWGVGFFDILENVFFVLAISSPEATNVRNLLDIGLSLAYVKAGFLFTTFGLTLVIIITSSIFFIKNKLRTNKA